MFARPFGTHVLALQQLLTAADNMVGQEKRGQDTFWSRFWRSRCRCLFRCCLPVATWHSRSPKAAARTNGRHDKTHSRICGGDDELLHVALVEQRIHIILWNSLQLAATLYRHMTHADFAGDSSPEHVEARWPAGHSARRCHGGLCRECWQFFQWLEESSTATTLQARVAISGELLKLCWVWGLEMGRHRPAWEQTTSPSWHSEKAHVSVCKFEQQLRIHVVGASHGSRQKSLVRFKAFWGRLSRSCLVERASGACHWLL